MAKIMKLTAEQERELPSFRERWRAVGLSTAPVHPEAARAAVTALYRAAKLDEPKAVIVLASPMACLLARGILKNSPVQLGDQLGGQLWDQLRGQLWGQLWGQLGDQLGGQLGDQLGGQLGGQLWDQLWDQLRGQLGGQLWDQLWDQLRDQIGDQLGGLFEYNYMSGGMDAFWLSFYEFGKILGAIYTPDADAFFDAYKTYALTSGWAYPYRSIAFVSDRPEEVHFDSSQRLHSDAGMSVRYRDGWGLYAWHGYRIPDDHVWIITDKARITAAAIMAEPNAELRRIMCEITGFEPIRSIAKCVAEDRDGNGFPRRLLTAEIGGEPIRIVEVENGSLEPDGTRRRFLLGAMPGETPHDVIAASYGISPAHYREAVRT